MDLVGEETARHYIPGGPVPWAGGYGVEVPGLPLPLPAVNASPPRVEAWLPHPDPMLFLLAAALVAVAWLAAVASPAPGWARLASILSAAGRGEAGGPHATLPYVYDGVRARLRRLYLALVARLSRRVPGVSTSKTLREVASLARCGPASAVDAFYEVMYGGCAGCEELAAVAEGLRCEAA